MGTAAAMPLESEFQFYLKNQDDLVRKFNGKFVVIKGTEVIGGFDDELAAIRNAQKQWDLGTFLVQKVEPGSEGYTQVFHSRVAFR